MTNIIVNLVIEGTHNWLKCNLTGVDFLKFPHRHMFYICAKKEVQDNDRQIEIISFKRKIIDYLSHRYGNPCDFKSLSCEMIAEELIKKFSLNYCSVLEDNENGAEVIKNH